MEVRLKAGGFSVSADLTDDGEVKEFLVEDEGGGLTLEKPEYEMLQRLVHLIEGEQQRALYKVQQFGMLGQPFMRTQQGGPLIGGNNEPEPPIEGDING